MSAFCLQCSWTKSRRTGRCLVWTKPQASPHRIPTAVRHHKWGRVTTKPFKRWSRSWRGGGWITPQECPWSLTSCICCSRICRYLWSSSEVTCSSISKSPWDKLWSSMVMSQPVCTAPQDAAIPGRGSLLSQLTRRPQRWSLWQGFSGNLVATGQRTEVAGKQNNRIWREWQKEL